MSLLTGLSRSVFSFAGRNWPRILALAVLPYLVITAVSIAMLRMMSGFMQDIIALEQAGGGEPDPEQVMRMVGGVFRFQLLALLGQALALAGMVYMAVRLTRDYLTDGADPAPLGSVIKASLFYALYGLGIQAIATVAGMLPGAIILGISGGVFFAIMGGGEPGAMTIILSVAVWAVLFLAWMFLVLWIACRFAVGLPRVAMGETPDFFADFWPLARGASFGVPLRLIAAYLIVMLLTWPIIGWQAATLVQILIATGAPDTPEVILEFQERLFGMLTWALPVLQLFSFAYVICAVLIFAEAYRRFAADGRVKERRRR